MGLITPESDLVGPRHAGVNTNLGIITEDAHPHLPYRVWTDVWARFGNSSEAEYRNMIRWCHSRYGGFDGWDRVPVWQQSEPPVPNIAWMIGTVWLFNSREIATEFMLTWC